MKNIKTFLVIPVLLIAITTFGQDSLKVKKTKEFYATPVDISPISTSLTYKCQLKNTTFFKLGLVDLSFSHEIQEYDNANFYSVDNLNLTGGVELGIEFRKKITEKLKLYHGPNLSYTYNVLTRYINNPLIVTSQRKRTAKTHNFGIPYTLGFLFNFNKHLLLSAELNFNVAFIFTKSTNGQNPNSNYTNGSINYNLSTRQGFLSIGYRL